MVCLDCVALLPPADDAPIPGLPAAAWPIVASFLFINDSGLLAISMASGGTAALLDQIAAGHWAIAEDYRARQEEWDLRWQEEFDAYARVGVARTPSEEFSD